MTIFFQTNILFYSCFDSTLSKINLFLSLRFFKKIYFPVVQNIVPTFLSC